MKKRVRPAYGLLTLALLACIGGCESEPKRADVRVDPQRVDAQRIDKQREDKMLPLWNAPKEKSWWEW
jgi:hypothetical protein